MRISDWSSDVCSSDLSVIDPDPDPAADEEPPAASRRPHLKLPRRGEHRAIDLRSVRIFVEPDAILDTIIRRRATGDQPPSGPAGGRQIAAQLAVARLAIPGRRIERLAIGGDRKSTRLNSSH